MRKITAVVLGLLLSLVGVAGVGQAQSAVQVQGTIESVDCEAGTVVLSTSNGSDTVSAANYTTVLVNSTSVEFCSLEGYVGSPVSVWLIPDGNQFSATQIAVTGPAAVTPVPAEAVSPVPIVGAVLGTIVVAGLVYLLVHGPDGGYYRYPYYGAYYDHYYHPQYRPYTGYYPASATIITAAPAIAGVTLGVVVVNNLQYILTRDSDGHLYRYPYYGPYHQYYYRSTYRSYTGVYQNVQVRQGDPRWDAPAHAISVVNHVQPAPQRQVYQPAPQRQVYEPAPRQQVSQPIPQRQVYQRAPQPQVSQPVPQRQVYQPAPQPQVSQPIPQRQVYQRAPQPQVSQPVPQRQVYQPAPRQQVSQPVPQRQVYQPAPQRQPNPASQNSGRENTRPSRDANQQCGGHAPNQPCSSGGSDPHK